MKNVTTQQLLLLALAAEWKKDAQQVTLQTSSFRSCYKKTTYP